MQREQVPVRYRQNAQTAALLDTLGLTADELAVLVEDVKAQFFVDTATWALPALGSAGRYLGEAGDLGRCEKGCDPDTSRRKRQHQ